VLSRHVPPISSARSKIVNESMPAFFSWIAMPMPANPAPMIAIGKAALGPDISRLQFWRWPADVVRSRA